MKAMTILLTLVFVSAFAHAAPDSFVYEGYLTDNGTAVNGSANLLLEIKIPSTSCVVYQKSYSAVTVNNGYFSVRVDNNPNFWWDNSNGASSTKFRQIFQAGTFPSGGLCSGGANPGATTERQMYITYQSGTNPVFGPISLESVPFATLASVADSAKLLENTSDLSVNNFKITNLATPTGSSDAVTKAYVDTVATSAANASNLSSGTIPAARLPYTPVNKAGDSMSGVLAMFNTASDPTCASGDSGKIWFNSTGNLMKYCDGSTIQTVGSGGGITSLNGSSITTQTFATPGTAGLAPNWTTNSGTGVHTLDIPMAATAGVAAGLISKAQYDTFNGKLSAVVGSSLNSGQFWVGNAGNTAAAQTMSGDATLSNAGALTIANDVITSSKILNGTISSADIADYTLGNDSSKFFSTPQQNRLLATSNVTGSQVVQFTCAAGESIRWNVSNGWECYTPSVGSGTVTSVAAGTGLTGGPITTTGTLSVDVGTTANKIVQLDGSARLPAVNGSLLHSMLPTQMSGGGASTGQTIAWNGTQWLPSNISDASKLPISGGTMTGSISMGSNNITFSPSGIVQMPFYGSAAAPQIRLGSSGMNGMYSPSVNSLAFSANSIQKMGISPSGVSVNGSLDLTGRLYAATDIVTGQVRTGTGTAGAAAFTTDLAPTTGIYFPNSALEIGLTFGGTETIRFKSGAVGIGTTSPGYPVDIRGSQIGIFQGVNIQNATPNGGAFYRATNAAGYGAFFGATGGTYTPGGIAEPTAALLYSEINLINGLNIGTEGATAPLKFFTAANEKMRLTSTGSLGLGTNAPTAKFDILTGSAVPSGTLSTTSGSATITGFGTSFDTEFAVGQDILIGGLKRKVSAPPTFNSMTVDMTMPYTISYARPTRVAMTTDAGSTVEVLGDVKVGGTIAESFGVSPLTLQSYTGGGGAMPHNNKMNLVWRPSGPSASSYLNCIKIGQPGQRLKIFWRSTGYQLVIQHAASCPGTGESTVFTPSLVTMTSVGAWALVELVYLPAGASGHASDGWTVMSVSGF